jgi:ATP-dependent phosphofructokinase / diphosphate-dependent phosphofructokinase
MAKKRIGILTGGGDVPGLNAVIKEVTYRGTEHDNEVVGIRRGWEGLTHVNLDDPESKSRYILPLSRENTRTIDRTGGTFLHSSRTNPVKMKKLPDFLKDADFPSSQSTKGGVTSTVLDMSKQVLKNLDRLGIEHLIAIGGDDTLSYAAHLDRLGVNIASVSRRQSHAPPTPSTVSAPRSAPTNVSGFSACSAAMPVIPRCTPLMSPRFAAAFRSTR